MPPARTSPPHTPAPASRCLVDPHARRLDYLRLSVTDLCNLRCRYCMPTDGLPLGGRQEVLSWEEMFRLCRVLTDLGIRKIRLTGGEPLARRGLLPFLQDLARLPRRPGLFLTTNGTLLHQHLPRLRRIGLWQLNVSLDSLRPDTYAAITRRDAFARVWRALERAAALGFELKINTVVLAGLNDRELSDFVKLTRKRAWTVRFIEAMPFDGQGGRPEHLVTGQQILARLQDDFELVPVASPGSSVDVLFQVPGWAGRVGIIRANARTFCSSCSRLRISTRGELRTCLYGMPAADLKPLLRGGASDAEIVAVVLEAVGQRLANGHLAEQASSGGPSHSMSVIGG